MPSYGSNLNLNKNQLLNAIIQVLSADPTSPGQGQIYFNSTSGKLRQYNGSSWVEYGTSTSNGDVTQGSNSAGAGRMKVSGGADKTIIDYAGGAGLVKTDANGVPSAATAGSDYVTGASTNTFTNKSYDAAGTGNSLTNLSTAMFAVNVIDTDTTLAANSNTRIASQQAVKSYIDNKVAGNLNYKGAVDASTNPNYPAAAKGDYYKISVAGKIGGAAGQSVSVGDAIIANTTNAGGTDAAVGASWDIIQANVEQATTSTLGLVALADATVAEAKSNSVKAVTPAALTNFTVKKIFTIGDGSTTAISVSDNLNTKDKIAVVRDATTDDMIIVDTKYNLNSVTFTFSVAPAANSYKVTVVG